jgi:hypothetical protein
VSKKVTQQTWLPQVVRVRTLPNVVRRGLPLVVQVRLNPATGKHG